MRNHNIKRLIMANSRGGVLVLVAVFLFLFIGIAALAIDIGFLSTTKNELQDVADAAALAGAGYLGSVYATLPPSQQAAKVFPPEDVLAEINSFKNKAAKSDIQIFLGDIKVGKWDPNALAIYDENQPGPDAVYVKAQRETNYNSRIITFFAGIFGAGAKELAVSAEAVAALSGPSVVAEGELITPFGISEKAFPNQCKNVIAFSPTPSSCAGWHDFFDSHDSSAIGNKMYNTILSDSCSKHCDDSNGLVNGATWLENNFNLNTANINPGNKLTIPTPSTSTGDFFDFNGGDLAALFNGEYLGDYDGNQGIPYKNGSPLLDKDGNPDISNAKTPAPMFALFDYFRYRDGDDNYTPTEPITNTTKIKGVTTTTTLYPQGVAINKDDIWTATIPVYKDIDGVDCVDTGNNVTGLTEIVGFAIIRVFQPNPPPSKDIYVQIDCDFTVIEARGGGGTYGNLKGTIPNLVK